LKKSGTAKFVALATGSFLRNFWGSFRKFSKLENRAFEADQDHKLGFSGAGHFC
jgi:hypothetical protein